MHRTLAVLILALSLALSACERTQSSQEATDAEPTPGEVVVYTALDDIYAREILDAFEAETGVTVRPVYDTEASKTTGLVTRLIAEKDRPRADVFWNNEVAQTIRLQHEGVLEPYVSPAAAAIPERFKDPDGWWTGFAARGRVIIYNTELMEAPPASIEDFLAPQWRGKCAIALPLFGTTATHAAALYALWGEEKTEAYLKGLLDNDVAVLAGNSTVRDAVARGDFHFGMTDTDDANGAVEDGLPAQWVFPDQGDGQIGTLVIPNTVALVRGAPHGEAGKRLIDYLLSRETEERLARMRSIQMPVNPAATAPENVPVLKDIRVMDVRFEDVARRLPESMDFVKNTFAE